VENSVEKNRRRSVIREKVWWRIRKFPLSAACGKIRGKRRIFPVMAVEKSDKSRGKPIFSASDKAFRYDKCFPQRHRCDIFQAKTQKKPVQARQKREIDRIFGR
jgi:hypothetical protein